MDIQELWDKYFEIYKTEDYVSIKKCLDELVKFGEFDAFSLIGDMYAHGEGVEQSSKKALEYYNLALEKGCVKAYCHIAHLYYYGLDIERDYKKAFETYKIASENNIHIGYYRMACMYLNGDYVEKNYFKAFENAQTARKMGLEKANKIIHKIEGLKFAFEEGGISRVALQSKLSIGFPLASEVFDWLKEQKYIDKDGKTILTKEEYEKLFSEV